ncbi:GIY-YIG nuclease family protein [Actinacidiphila acididurans]|uniref:GIY-YIG nuclease family protein n=1 Tax=Actinacidiphila acididurans TaxID=2784346 RepID=A0ABS2U304_9ACTN|nr:GIY-YIG nuclease family protein [Actinacidiphila acididurans]MBM9509973.1 GIY-YIG nuclease family protein [Actinacidiphila acididurans]
MPKPSRTHVKVVKPFTPRTLTPDSGRSGISRHIPAPGDPALPGFIRIATEWSKAGIEMTDEIVAAAAKLARARLQESREANARIHTQRETQAQRLAELKPGIFGDAPGGVVYYIRRGDYVKIGTTTKLRQRMRDLMPDEVLAVEPGSYGLESELHAKFASIRFAAWCEYFKLTPDLQQHIDTVLDKNGPPPPGLSQFLPHP